MEETKNKKEPMLLIDYIFDDIKPDMDEIFIENKKYLIKEIINKNMNINFNEYEKELGSKILSMTLKNQCSERTHYFEVISGVNVGILFPSFGDTRDIIFPDDKEYKVKITSTSSSSRHQKEFSIKGRLLLINFNSGYELYINDKLITAQILGSCTDGRPSQISLVDLDKRIFLHKTISPLKFDLFFDAYEKEKNSAKYFFDSINEFFNKKKFDFNEYKKLFINAELIRTIMHKYNLPKNILKNKYNKKEYFEFISSCTLYFIMCSLKEEKEINDIYKYFIDYKNKLEKDSNLEYYQKNINTKTLEKDSLLESTISFLINFINDIDMKSPFIYPLILIDSGNYVYGNENAYGYGLTNLEILKLHLNNIIPDIIITINDEEKKSEEAISNKLLGTVKLNLSSKLLSPFNHFKIDQKIEDKNISINLELILFITFFHEIFGHKKGGYAPKKKDICNSPNVFYDKKEKKILKLVNRNSFILSGNEVPILRKKEEDAGHFLEYFIGKCEYGFFSEIIDILLLNNIKLNFILDIDMWNKKIDIMRKYVKLKYIIYSYDKNLLDKKIFNDIYDEIKMLENIIKEKCIDLDKIKKINDRNYVEKKEEDVIIAEKHELNENSEKKDEINYEEYKNYSSDELLDIALKEETPSDVKEIIYKIIFSRIIKA